MTTLRREHACALSGVVLAAAVTLVFIVPIALPVSVPVSLLMLTAGEAVRVAVCIAVCIALGYVFADNIPAARDLTGAMPGILAGAAAMAAFGYWLLGAMCEGNGPE